MVIYTVVVRGNPHRAIFCDGQTFDLIEDIATRGCQIGQLDLSRFDAAPGARLSHLPFEGDRTFPTQC